MGFHGPFFLFKDTTMKQQNVQSHKIENDKIVPVHKSKLILEASERYELFQEKFLDSGLKIQTSFEEKNSDLILALLNSNRPINELNFLPKPLVVCTVTLVDGDDKIFSATADAPTHFTAPYKASETMALTRLFDRLDIPSIVHEHEIGDVSKSSNNCLFNSTNDSTTLTGTEEFPVDLASIPSRKDLTKSEIEDKAKSLTSKSVVEPEATADDETQAGSIVEPEATVDDETQAESVVEPEATVDDETQAESVVEPEATADDETQAESVVEPEATADFSLTSQSVSDEDAPVFPSGIPLPFHVKLTEELKLKHGNDWVNHIPLTKQEAYTFLRIR